MQIRCAGALKVNMYVVYQIKMLCTKEPCAKLSTNIRSWLLGCLLSAMQRNVLSTWWSTMYTINNINHSIYKLHHVFLLTLEVMLYSNIPIS